MRAGTLLSIASPGFAFLFLCRPTFAQAPTNYEIVSASGPGTQKPACPGPKKVVGGGAFVPSFQFIHESRPESNGTGWRATAQGNAFIQAYAICANVNGSYLIWSGSGTGTQNAACPGLRKALGGGAWVPGFQFIHESRPESGGTGWRATAQGNVFIQVYAICANTDASYQIVPASGVGTQNPTCPGSTKALGGGAFVPGFQFVHESRPESGGTGWRATAQSNAFLQAYAVCGAIGPSIPGEVPLLLVSKISPTMLRLNWTASCSTAALDYAVYQGALGAWYSHMAVDCTDNLSDLREDVPMPGNDAYFLVVATTPSEEGSYGRSSSGVERPTGATTCVAAQSIQACTP